MFDALTRIIPNIPLLDTKQASFAIKPPLQNPPIYFAVPSVLLSVIPPLATLQKNILDNIFYDKTISTDSTTSKQDIVYQFTPAHKTAFSGLPLVSAAPVIVPHYTQNALLNLWDTPPAVMLLSATTDEIPTTQDSDITQLILDKTASIACIVPVLDDSLTAYIDSNNLLQEYEAILQQRREDALELAPENMNYTYLTLAENRIIQDMFDNYQNYLAAKEQKILQKSIERQQENNQILEQEIRSRNAKEERIFAENKVLYEKMMAKKAKNARKRRAREEMMNALRALLFGSDTEESMNAQDSDTAPPVSQTQESEAIESDGIKAVEKIHPITFGKNPFYGFFDDNIDDLYDPLDDNHHLYAGQYRSWCEQNVFFKCIHPERGPPALWH